MQTTQEVDPDLIRVSVDFRMTYVKDFLNFSREQEEILAKVAPLVNDIIPEVVDDLYAKLFEFDITKQVGTKSLRGFSVFLTIARYLWREIKDSTVLYPQSLRILLWTVRNSCIARYLRDTWVANRYSRRLQIFMKAWARRILTSDYSSPKTWAYMDKGEQFIPRLQTCTHSFPVGIMHTGVKSFKHRANSKPLVVPCVLYSFLIHCFDRACLQIEIVH